MGSITDIKDPILDKPIFDPRREFSESTRTGENKPVSELPPNAPQSDVSGSTLLNQIKDYTLPPSAMGKEELVRALSTLQGKTTQIQESLTLVMGLYTQPGDKNVPITVNDLVDDLFRAATSKSGASALNVFCRGLESMISQAMDNNKGNADVLDVCNIAKEMIDLLNDPDAQRNDAFGKLMNSLQQKANGCLSDDAAKKLAGGLAVIFGAALDALNLSTKLHDLIPRIGTPGIPLPANLAELSGLVTVVAMMSLMALVTTQVSAEIEARMNLAEDEDKLRDQRIAEQKKQDEKRTREMEKESALDLAESSSVMSDALTKSFGEVLAGGMGDAFSLVMNKVIEARQSSRATVEA